MRSADAILTLRINTSQPIELDAFVGAFTSLAHEFKREIRANHPEADGEPKVYVKEIRKGSYEADLIPYVAVAAPFIAQMDQVLIAEQFIRTWVSRITSLISGELGEWKPTKSELATWTNATQAIATDPNANSTLEVATFEDDKRKVRASFVFNTPQAIDAQKTIDATYRELEKPNHSDHQRVLMVFTRSDTGSAHIGKKSGERVVIEEISSKSLAIMYASELAEGRIKHEIRDSEDNIYKKGFAVDVNVRTVNGKPSVYAITHVHEIIDLPEENE